MTLSDFQALRRILIVKPSSLGDIVHTLPLLSCLRRSAPQAEFRWLVNSVWAPLLRGHPHLDGLIEFPRDRMRGLAAPRELACWLGTLDWRPDLALDVQGLLRSALLARATRARRIAGYSDAREGANLLHHEVVDVSRQRSPHAVDRYLTALDWLGLERPALAEFALPPGDEPAGAEELPEAFIALHPFSRGRGKSLNPEQVEGMVSGFALPVVVVGKAEGINLRLANQSLNWLNRTTLLELVWVLRKARWVVSVDSGPMHLAAALTSNLVAIHTWSDPAKVGPYAPDAWVWKSGHLQKVRNFQAISGGGMFSAEAIRDIAGLINSGTDS